MTKLIQQLSFSSSNYYDVAGTVVEPEAVKVKSYQWVLYYLYIVCVM